MRTAAKRALGVALSALVGLSGSAALVSSASAQVQAYDVLVFSKTAGFRHGSIPNGIAMIQDLGQENDFAVEATEDAAAFTSENLSQYQAVVFLSTTGDVLNSNQQAAFEQYIQSGGGFVGIHAAADTEYDWAWYGELVGAYFDSHPAIQEATVNVEDPAHPSTQGLPAQWTRTDEWYNYQTNPRSTAHVLASLDEDSYDGGNMGADHPIAWCQDYDGGRSWYTGGGHTNASYQEPEFRAHVLAGIQTAAGAVPADCGASLTANFDKITLDDDTSNPMELDIAPDGRVFYLDRLGAVNVIDPATQQTVPAAQLDVFTENESGGMGIALDPDFAQNNWVYIFYSPAGEPVDRLSRFTVTTDNTLDMASETVVLDVPVQREECCHHGGSLAFAPDGSLYISTGDNTNPFDSDGYTPIDERDGRSAWDAQKSSANTNDLRGKVLRIVPQDDGTYTIPEGNLFAPGTAQTMPEIYAMGFRNPFRIGVDPQTGYLLAADYGPDNNQPDAERGPEGRVEWNLIKEAGNYGWPYCVGENTPYVDYVFRNGPSGEPFDCANPVNDSPNNTGLTDLPPAQPATVWYGRAANSPYVELGTGGAPMGGDVYRFDPDLESDRKWPAYYDGKAFFSEWGQNRMFTFQLDGNSELVDINELLAEMDFLRPMDFHFGPDGALYLIEWGSGFSGNNTDSGIYRIDYVKGNRPPVARASADQTSGPAPLTVTFSSEGSFDPDGQTITFAWDFNGDGTVDSTEPNPTHTYTDTGNFTAQLQVTDTDGMTGVSNIPITVGNTAPSVTLNLPKDGGFFEFGDQVAFEVVVTDPEDGTVDCSEVTVATSLGHAGHFHPMEDYQGCEGIIQTLQASGHGIEDDIFYVAEARYTDHGGEGDSDPLTGSDLALLQPKRKQAEHYSDTGRTADGQGSGDPGVQTEETGDTQGGGLNIGWIEDGDWWSFEPINLTAIDGIRFRGASPSTGGTVEVRWNAPDGPVLASGSVPTTGDWQVYQDITVDLADPPTESGTLYFVARRPEGSDATGGLFNVNWVDFLGKGMTENQRPEVSISADPTGGTAPVQVDFTSEASDPEGDLPLTYEWDFGVDGAPNPTTPEASYTYQTPGTYTASLTVTDARGAAATAYVEIEVGAPDPGCLTGRSDDFEGDSLDRSRWTTVVRENQDLRVENGSLVIPSTPTDIYSTAPGDTPNIVLQPLPEGPWQATAKLTLDAQFAFTQAGLVVYGDDDNYAKMVFEARSDEGDKASRIFQFIREENGEPNEVGDSNTDGLGADYPDTVFVRFASNGSDLRAFYSADGLDWTQMPETKALAGIENPHIGLIALNGHDRTQEAEAFFDWFQITPDDTAGVPGPNDEFDGTALDECRWDAIVRPDPGGYRVADGHLEIDTANGDIYGGDNSGPTNFILQSAPEGDWTIETKIDGSAFDEQYQQGGLMVYADDGNYVKFDYLVDNQAGSAVDPRIELRSEVDEVVQQPAPNVGEPGGDVWHLRLIKEGDTFTGYYSADGEDWTAMSEPVTNPALASGAKAGLFVLGAAQQASKTARFDYFHLTPAGTGPTCDTPTEPEEGYTSLFDGTEASLSAWAMAGPGGFDLTDECVLLSQGGLGLYWYTAQAFTNYSLKLDWKVAGDDNSGVFVGFPDPGDDPWSAVNQGHEVQIDMTDVPERTTGAIYAFQSADIEARDGALNPPGDWNEYEITVSGQTITVYLNGVLINEYTDVDPARMNPPSYVGIQNHGPGDDVFFRNIRIMELADDTVPPTTAAEFAPPGDEGWHVGGVPITLTATDNEGGSGLARTEYSLDGGPWTAYTGPVAVDGDGEHELRYRSVDNAGNEEEIQAATLRIDATKPTVLVSGVVDGAVYGDSEEVRVSFAASDATSGVAEVTGMLDGAEIADGQTVSLYELSIGLHTIEVTATDRAGNVATQAVGFAVDTSLADMRALVDRFHGDGTLSRRAANRLHAQLNRARAVEAHDLFAQGVRAMDEFRRVAADERMVGDATVRAVLTRDADVMIDRYQAAQRAAGRGRR